VIKIEDIVQLRGARPEGSTRLKRRAAGPVAIVDGIGRRTLFRAAAVAGASVGVAALGVFPPARKALADGYDIIGHYSSGSPCSSGQYAVNHNCSPGCGPSPNCVQCCSGSGWHQNNYATYFLRPNACWGGWADGWLWSTPNCAGCGTRTWRCHDGAITDGYTFYPTICRWSVGCS
jgi:hypothetical protein